jgi:hypothetical protein
MMEIMFFNKLTKNYNTMHSMGLSYNEVSVRTPLTLVISTTTDHHSSFWEGADCPNSTTQDQNSLLPTAEAVAPVSRGIGPGEVVVYKWLVPELARPSFGAPSATHSHHSYVSMQQYTNAGLISPEIVYARGMMNSTLLRCCEIPLLYMV